MSTEARQIRRLTAQLAEAQQQIVDRDQQIEQAERRMAVLRRQVEAEIKKVLWRWENAEALLKQERFFRYCAQQGLANYMREHGLGDRIGYEPQADPAASKLLKSPLLKELAGQVIGVPDQDGAIANIRPDLIRVLADRAVV